MVMNKSQLQREVFYVTKSRNHTYIPSTHGVTIFYKIEMLWGWAEEGLDCTVEGNKSSETKPNRILKYFVYSKSAHKCKNVKFTDTIIKCYINIISL